MIKDRQCTKDLQLWCSDDEKLFPPTERNATDWHSASIFLWEKYLCFLKCKCLLHNWEYLNRKDHVLLWVV